MRASRAAGVVAGSAAILGIGYATAPKDLPTVDLAESETDEGDVTGAVADDEAAEPEATPSVVCEDELVTSDDDDHDDDDDYDDDDDDDDHEDDDDDDDDDLEDDDHGDDDDVQVITVCATVTPEPATDSGDGAATGGDGASGTFDGPVVTNIRGDFQARIVVEGGTVVSVDALAAGTSAAESQIINAEAIPALSQRVLEAQDWDVDAYSGASYTSPAFLESVQGAFAEAGL